MFSRGPRGCVVPPPTQPPYPTAPSTARASTAPRLARMEAMTTTSLPRCAGAGSMVLGLAAGRRRDEGGQGGYGGLRGGAMERGEMGLGEIGDCFSPPHFGVMA